MKSHAETLQNNLNVTIILIAHRLSSLKKANLIILIENGQIKEVGKPDIIFKDSLIND